MDVSESAPASRRTTRATRRIPVGEPPVPQPDRRVRGKHFRIGRISRLVHSKSHSLTRWMHNGCIVTHRRESRYLSWRVSYRRRRRRRRDGQLTGVQTLSRAISLFPSHSKRGWNLQCNDKLDGRLGAKGKKELFGGLTGGFPRRDRNGTINRRI